MKKVILLFCLLVGAQSIWSQECGGRYFHKIFPQTKVTKSIYYGENLYANGTTKRLLFDVYEPFGDQQKLRPVLVMMHGGAYWSGDKDHGQCKFLGEDLSKMGYVVMSPQYRYEPSFISLLDEEKMVKAVARGNQDARAMIRFLYKNAREEGNTWGIDTNLIFVGGASAGALNALHLAYLDEEDEGKLPEKWWNWIQDVGGIQGVSGTPDYPIKVAGIVSISGALARASLMENNFVPFLSIHDIGDPQIPFTSGQPYSIPMLPVVDGSSVLHDKALELGIPNPFYIIPGNGHTSYEELGMKIQPMYDSTVWYIKHFLYDNICERNATLIKENKLHQIQIVPNPSKGQFSVEWPVALKPNSFLQIYDMSGKLLYKVNQEQHRQNLQLQLPQGQYSILLLEDNKAIGKSVFQVY